MPELIDPRAAGFGFVSGKRNAPDAISKAAGLSSISGNVEIQQGSDDFSAQAVRTSGIYSLGIGEFVWTSKDKLITITNITALSGGGLVDEAGVDGTLIERVVNADPHPGDSETEPEGSGPGKTYGGNVLLQSAQLEKAHGVAPQQATINYVGRGNRRAGDLIQVQIHNQFWEGIVRDIKTSERESGGVQTSIQALDFRYELFNDVVFGKVNLVDETNGSVVSDYTFDNESFPTTAQISAKDLLEDLASRAGFAIEYASIAEARITQSTASWATSRFNVFNIDWSDGLKLGNAMDEIVQRLGLQITILHTGSLINRTLRLTASGDRDYQNPAISFSSSDLGELNLGNALQTDVDTGIWIVGGRNLYQRKGLTCSPAWNTAWNDYWLNARLLAKDLSNAGLNTFNLVEEFLPDEGFAGDKKFNQMTIKEYLDEVPFKIYRLDIMDDWLSESLISQEVYDGDKRPTEELFATPLIDDPRKQWIVKAHRLSDSEKHIIDPLDQSTELMEMGSGVQIDLFTGHVIFQNPKFQINATNTKTLVENDIVADEPIVDIVIPDEQFKEFFGTNDRVGSRRVQNLVRRFVQDELGSTFNEFILPDERSADDYAEDIATSELQRARILTSGDIQIFGSAGYVPDGEIYRVSTQLNNGGITESVTLAADQPGPGIDTRIELRRKIAVARQTKELDARDRRIRQEVFQKAVERAQSSASVAREGQDVFAGYRSPLFQSRTSGVNKDNFIVVDPYSSPEAYAIGEPVAGALVGADRRYRAVEKSTVEANDKRLLGVSVSSGDGSNEVVVSGPAHALVMGPVTQGDSLQIAASGGHFEAGEGPIIAMQDVADTGSPVLSIVKVGGGAGGSGNTKSVVGVLVDTSAIPTAISAEGTVYSQGDKVLIINLSVEPDGIYVVAANGDPWTFDSSPVHVVVSEAKGGASNPYRNTSWIKFDSTGRYWPHRPLIDLTSGSVNGGVKKDTDVVDMSEILDIVEIGGNKKIALKLSDLAITDGTTNMLLSDAFKLRDVGMSRLVLDVDRVGLIDGTSHQLLNNLFIVSFQDSATRLILKKDFYMFGDTVYAPTDWRVDGTTRWLIAGTYVDPS